jgi:hypothetical protein
MAMNDSLRRLLAAAMLMTAYGAHAQTMAPLPPESVLVAASGAPTPTQENFSIATAQDLVVTFTDLQVPGAFTSANVVVTQGAGVVGTVALAPPATTASLSLPGAVGAYTLSVIGVPDATFNVGTFTVCVAPKANPTACIADASLTGNVAVQTNPAAPTISTYSTTLAVVSGGDYTFTYTDLQFPVALAVAPSFSLFQGVTPLAVPLAASPATVTLAPGVYTLFGIAQADSTATAGLYGITVAGPAGVAPLLDNVIPVGTLKAAAQVSNTTAQTLTLSATDYAFPSALASGSLQVIVTSGASNLASAAAGSPASFSALAGTLQIWSHATAGSGAGTYEVDLASATQLLLQSPVGVDGGGMMAYAYVTPDSLSAAVYQATANDFQFPVALQGVQIAVAQNDAIVQKAATLGSFNFTAVAAPAVVLVAATPPASGDGMFDVNLQTTGSAPQVVFDQVQGVSASGAISSQTVSIANAGNYDVTLTDLGFPQKFANLALVVSNAGAVLGKIYGGGTFTIDAAATAYQLSFVATPGSSNAGVQAQYGLYGLQIVNSAPTLSLSASPTSVTTGGTAMLSWTSANATACTASGGSFTGSEATSGTASVTVSATTTYGLTCTGPGGSATQSVSVTATPPASHGGGGRFDLSLLIFLSLLCYARARYDFDQA